MWDLAALDRMNEEAYNRFLERSDENFRKLEPVLTAPQMHPLVVLGNLLRIGPPDLRYLQDILTDSDTVAKFDELLHTYLPEHEGEIVNQDNDRKVVLFAHYFNQKYFPLADAVTYGDAGLGDIVEGIPIDFMGFSDQVYHNFMTFRNGFILMLALVAVPWDDDDEITGQGFRVPVLERAIELLGKDMVGLIPQDGWSPEDLNRRLASNENLQGVADFANWVHAGTGYAVLDTTPSAMEMSGESIPWEDVDDLAGDWTEVVDCLDRMRKTAMWLEEDLEHRFRQLLAIILDRQELTPIPIAKEQLVLMPAERR